jgi:hypothetical protein
MSCASGKQYDAGLCYTPCRDKFRGVGPVCWSTPPIAGWVDCGFGSAKDDKDCATVITDQILSAGMLALSIATLGRTSMILVNDVAKHAAEYAQLAKDWNKLIDNLQAVQNSLPCRVFDKIRQDHNDFFTEGAYLATFFSQAKAITDPVDIVRIAATILSYVDRPNRHLGCYRCLQLSHVQQDWTTTHATILMKHLVCLPLPWSLPRTACFCYNPV